MDSAILIVYFMLGGITLFGGIGAVTFVAGKDIFYAFYRRFVPKGIDVYVLNYSRQVDHYYKTPDIDGILRIKGKPYIINPNKILNLGDEFKAEVQRSLEKRKAKFNARIEYFNKKIHIISDKLKEAEIKQLGEIVINQLKEQKVSLENKKIIVEDKLRERMNSYYYKRRPMLLYIENDPIPKDMFEFYTEMDSIMIDNVVARTMTKDPKSTKDLEKFLKLAKMLLIIGTIASIGAVLIAFYNQNAINQIADHIGMTIKI